MITYPQGHGLRAARVAAGLTVTECARRFRCSPMRWCRLEDGALAQLSDSEFLRALKVVSCDHDR